MKHIAVIGAGPAGAVAASLLAMKGYTVSLIYRDQTSDYKAGETISPHGNDVIKRLGLEALFATEQHIQCPGNQSAFGSESLNDVDFLYSPHGQGWHLDRVVFERQLLERAVQKGVLLLPGSSLESAIHCNGEWSLSIKRQISVHQMKVDYLVDATGGARALLRQLNIPINKLDRLAARVAVFKVAQAHTDHRTMVESTEFGWWYSTTLSDFRRVIMFFSDTSDSEFKHFGNDDNFIDGVKRTNHIWPKLHRELSHKLGVVTNNDVMPARIKPLSFLTKPAATTWAHRIQGRGWIAIGDSAMTFDPLSSQGIFTALCSAEEAVKQILTLDQQGLITTDIVNSAYIEWAERTFSLYIEERTQYYGTEQRWPNGDFWVRRQKISI